MAGLLGASSAAAIFYSNDLLSLSPPAQGLNSGRKFFGGIRVPLRKGRCQFSVTISNVATEISPHQEQKLAPSKETQRPVYSFAAIVGKKR